LDDGSRMNREAHVRFCERLGVKLPRPTYQSGANTAAIEGIRADSGADIEMRQNKYLNNIVEQDHRAIKRIVRPMLGFKNFRCARALIAGIETMHMIKKGQLNGVKDRFSSAAARFYSLAF
jgi:putative transposase